MKAMHQWGGFGQTVGAFTLGATAGSLLALLMAPASGDATRKRIGRQFKSWQRSTVRELRQTGKNVTRRAGQWRVAAVRALHHRAAA